MKKECDIVQDLLFGYVDNTLKYGSKELVEEHLKKCKECESILNDIKNDENNDIEKIDGFKKVNKKMKNRKYSIIFLIIVFSLFIIFNIIVFVNYISDAGRLEVYLKEELDENKIEEIENIIYNIDEEAEIFYVSKSLALEESRTRMIYKDEENFKIFEGYSDENNPFPPYFIIKSGLSQTDKIIEAISQLDEVQKIKSLKNTNPYVYFITTFITNN